MQSFDITEKVIEDIFSSDKSLLADVLLVNPGDLSQIARQKKFDSKRNFQDSVKDSTHLR